MEKKQAPDASMDDIRFTLHARRAIAERDIQVDWVIRTLRNPDLRSDDPNDSDVERFFRHIPERDNRVLRVAVNTQAHPWTIITSFFDRKMKGKT